MALSKEWIIAPKPPPEILHNYEGIPPLVARLLFNRGLLTPNEIQNFLSPDGSLGNPFAMKGVPETVDRIEHAIRGGEKIAVYGDFDADGVTATALLTETLEALGADVTPHIPHRIEEGYGLNAESLRGLRERGMKLVVTVDCGIRSWDEVEAGNSMGLDMIVTDHHSVGDRLPNALAVVNPKQEGDAYPFKEFSGAGVAFKLAQALASRNHSSVPEDDLLELAALGTVADLVPLTGENRALVKRGLRRLGKSERPGLRALIAHATRTVRADAGSVGFFYGPRLNAAGRIDHARHALELLTTRDEKRASELAAQLESTNRERQKMTEELVQRAREMVLPFADRDPILIVESGDFPEGIIGLIAGKLQEEFYKPAIAIHLGVDAHRGSARSIQEFNIVRALDECRDLLIRHGGHSAAAGFGVSPEKLSALKERLFTIAFRELGDVQLLPTLHIDADVSLSEMNFNSLREIEMLAPFGYGNRAPLFVAHNVIVKHYKIVGNNHLKLILSDGRITWDGIAFRRADRASDLRPLPRRVDLVFALSANEWQGEKRLQFDIKDLRVND